MVFSFLLAITLLPVLVLLVIEYPEPDGRATVHELPSIPCGY